MESLIEKINADIRNKVGPWRTLIDISNVILQDPEHKCPDVLINILKDTIKASEESIKYLIES